MEIFYVWLRKYNLHSNAAWNSCLHLKGNTAVTMLSMLIANFSRLALACNIFLWQKPGECKVTEYIHGSWQCLNAKSSQMLLSSCAACWKTHVQDACKSTEYPESLFILQGEANKFWISCTSLLCPLSTENWWQGSLQMLLFGRHAHRRPLLKSPLATFWLMFCKACDHHANTKP